MAEQTHAIKRVEKVRGKDVEGKVRVLERTYPHQLTLFQNFIPEDDPDDKYSNTIELYDAVSPPYTFLLLNGDMEFYRNRHFFI